MKMSYEGIGQWTATFSCSNVKEGDLVKVVNESTVATCKAGDFPCGQAIFVDRDGKACTVALGGLFTISYAGDMSIGWNTLAWNGSGCVVEDSEDGWDCLVVSVDRVAKKVTIRM